MKVALIFLSLLVLALVSEANQEPLKSQEVRAKACLELVREYPVRPSYWDYDIMKFGIKIDEQVCDNMTAMVIGKQFKKLGSKSLVIGLDLNFSNENFDCGLRAIRSEIFPNVVDELSSDSLVIS